VKKQLVKQGRPHYGSLPRRFRRPRLVLLGCGDVGLRFVRMYADRLHILGVVRRTEALDAVRAAGATPLRIDLDDLRASRRLRGLAPYVLHSAPPPASGKGDARTKHALQAMPQATAWVYLSTTGVYGDCGGARFDETRAVAPRNERALRRVAAETQLRRRAATGATRVNVLRVPGIYAGDRLPVERLQRGTPALIDADWPEIVGAVGTTSCQVCVVPGEVTTRSCTITTSGAMMGSRRRISRSSMRQKALSGFGKYRPLGSRRNSVLPSVL
jgi:hypothetical protein